MARLYADENFPLPVVQELRSLGHDVITLQEHGHGGEAITDPQVLDLATTEGRSVLTLNRKDFIHLHAQQPAHAGIIVCTVDADFPRQAQRIDSTIRSADGMRGLLVRINRPSE